MDELQKFDWVKEVEARWVQKINPDNAVGVVKEIINRLVKKYPQTAMNGKDNVWVVKKTASSRGRGINFYHDY